MRARVKVAIDNPASKCDNTHELTWKVVWALKPEKRGMTTGERRKAIVETAQCNGMVHVSELTERFGLSAVSIRKDLNVLERHGLLARVHGGAVLADQSEASIDFEDRFNVNRPQKLAIARAAAALIQDGDSIMVNVGSTTALVVDALKQKKNLSVITNAFPIYERLAGCANITTFFLGGQLDQRCQTTVGESVIEQLARFTADKLILGVDGIDPEGGVTSYNHVEDYIIHRMIAQSRTRIVVADSSKLGRKALIRMADMESFDILVSDRPPKDTGILQAIEEKGVRVILTD